MFDFDALSHAIARQTVLCVGDLMLDEFVYGEVSRISPEAPAPVIAVQRSESNIGGAGNVARNIASLGARCIFVGLVGEDEAGERLRAELSIGRRRRPRRSILQGCSGRRGRRCCARRCRRRRYWSRCAGRQSPARALPVKSGTPRRRRIRRASDRRRKAPSGQPSHATRNQNRTSELVICRACRAVSGNDRPGRGNP